MKITLEPINRLKQDPNYIALMVPGLENICNRLLKEGNLHTTPRRINMYKSLRNKLEELRGDWDWD